MASDQKTMQLRIETLCLDYSPPVLRELAKIFLPEGTIQNYLYSLNIHEFHGLDQKTIEEMKKCQLSEFDFTTLVVLLKILNLNSSVRSSITKLNTIRNTAIHDRTVTRFEEAEEILLNLANFVDSNTKSSRLYEDTKTKIEDLKRTEVRLNQKQNKLRERLKQGNKYVTDFFQPLILTGNISGCQNEVEIRKQLDIDYALTSAKMVLEFDGTSNLREKTEKGNSVFTIRTAENVYSDKQFGDLLSKSPVWIYCNGYDKSSHMEEKGKLNLKEWRLKRQKGVKKALTEMKTIYSGSLKVVILVYEKCVENDPLFKITKDLIENDHPDVCDIIIISDNDDFVAQLKKASSDYLYEDQIEDLFLTGMSWDLVSDEIKTSFRINTEIDCILPCRAGNTVVMTKTERNAYTDIEILSGEECIHELGGMDETQSTNKMEETKETFYKGKGISWWNFYFEGQVGKRSAFDDYCRNIRNKLEKGKVVERFELSHSPGAGGTTLGMHILWQFSQFSQSSGSGNSYRCCRLKTITPSTKQQLVNLCMFKEKENQKPVIVLIDDEQEDSVNDFYEELYEEARKLSSVRLLCCVVIVKRVPTGLSDKTPLGVLSPKLKHDEKIWFDNKYKELEDKYNTDYVNSLISFNFLKNSYDPEVIQRTTNRLMKEVKKEEKDILKCLSVIGTFERKRYAVPFRVFDVLMTGPQRKNTWNTCLSEAMSLFITEIEDDDATGISVISQPLAKAILDNFRTAEGISLEFVVRFLLDLIEKNQSSGRHLSQKLKAIVGSLFKREFERSGLAAAGKDDFSGLICKLSEQRNNETPESAHKRVLQELEKCFELTEDPMVGQQVARFYNHVNKFSEAEQTIKKAIEMKQNRSSFLLDTYGHIFKTKMVFLIYQGAAQEKKITDDSVSEIIDMAFEAISKFNEGQTVAYKEHLKSTKRNISPFYNELWTVIALLENFKKFESYTNHQDLIDFLNESDFHNGESPFRGLVELCPKVLELRQGTEYQIHLMEILQYIRDRTNQIKFYKIDFEEGNLLLNFSERLSRFYGDSKTTGHCYFTCPIDFKAIMGGMNTDNKKKHQVLMDRFEAAKKNLESQVADIDDRDLLVYLGVRIIQLSGPHGSAEQCSEEEYKKLLMYSKCLLESQTQIPGRILLEVFLYHGMLHWPSDDRVDNDYDNFCPPKQYKEYLKKWEKNFYINHSLQTLGQKEVNRPKTFFAFGKGSPGNDIINLKVIQQRFREIEKDRGIATFGPFSDEVWDEDIVKEQLQSFKGFVNGEGSVVFHKVIYSQERCSEIQIPMYKYLPELSNREVTFFIGFSWKGPMALGVKNLSSVEERESPQISPRSSAIQEPKSKEETPLQMFAVLSNPKKEISQTIVKVKTVQQRSAIPLEPVMVKDAQESRIVVASILKDPPDKIILSCVWQQLGQGRSCFRLIVLNKSPEDTFVFHLHDTNLSMFTDGHLMEIFKEQKIQKVFFDIGTLSETLIQDYDIVMDGKIWDVKIMLDYLSKAEPDGLAEEKDARYRFSVWFEENLSFCERLSKDELDGTVVDKLVDRGQHIMKIFERCKGSSSRRFSGENAVEQLKDFLDGYNRTWSDLGLVPGFSIIRPES